MFSLNKKVEGKEEKQDVKELDIEDDYREQAKDSRGTSTCKCAQIESCAFLEIGDDS